MTSNQCEVLFSDIDLRSFVYHNVHGHPKFAIYPAKLIVEGELVRDEFPDWGDAL